MFKKTLSKLELNRIKKHFKKNALYDMNTGTYRCTWPHSKYYSDSQLKTIFDEAIKDNES